MKKLAYFDQNKFNSASRIVAHNLKVLNEHLKQFNKIVDPSAVVNDIDSLLLSIVNPSHYVKSWLLKDKEFPIGGKKLSEEKIFELGLEELPGWYDRSVNLVTIERLIEFRVDDYVFEGGEVKVSSSVEDRLRDNSSFYLLPEKEEEFELLNKLIKNALASYPNRVNENKFATLVLYLEEKLRLEVMDGEVFLIPNPSSFSEKIRYKDGSDFN